MTSENKAYRMPNTETRYHTVALTTVEGNEITVRSGSVLATEPSNIGGTTIIHVGSNVSYVVMESQQQIWEMIQADGPILDAFNSIKNRDSYRPKLGDRTLCESCAGEIEYVGPYWRHVGQNPRHNAIPPQTFHLLPQKKA